MGARKSCLETERNKRRRQFQNFRITSSYNFMSRKRAIETAVGRRQGRQLAVTLAAHARRGIINTGNGFFS